MNANDVANLTAVACAGRGVVVDPISDEAGFIFGLAAITAGMLTPPLADADVVALHCHDVLGRLRVRALVQASPPS